MLPSTARPSGGLPPTFTVAVCTWNRASLLLETLESLASLDRCDSAWELIVVNNDCTDETEEVLDRMTTRLPLRRVFERMPGISNARNAAVRHARGDYIVWTDDDVIVDKDWLRAYERAVKRWPEAAVFGGPVRPRFQGTPPLWLAEIWPDVAGLFAICDLGTEPLELTTKRLPFGPNFVTRAREQRRFLYDPALGKRRAGGALGEEVAVIEAILAAGGTGRWVPDAAVRHWIPKERQTMRYLRHNYTLLGRAWHRQNRRAPGTSWGDRRSLWPKALYAAAKYTCALLTGNPRRWVKPLARAWTLWGAIRDRRPGAEGQQR